MLLGVLANNERTNRYLNIGTNPTLPTKVLIFLLVSDRAELSPPSRSEKFSFFFVGLGFSPKKQERTERQCESRHRSYTGIVSLYFSSLALSLLVVNPLSLSLLLLIVQGDRSCNIYAVSECVLCVCVTFSDGEPFVATNRVDGMWK